ncbi:MraY family glycosyltransferase [Pseudomonas agarici]|uniref:MraY family glycosyltransferase n=1 Tax=Pseudomonas agarici TaxID=46677 RepID=UPI0015A142BD|nr:glycosyltransferase family 4 protein [Pseudomonas agarici]NWB91692.1 glycosyltransferase family 4 protein [Pseudomonas agarici]
MNMLFLIFPFAFLLSFFLAIFFRRYALRRSLIDIPNNRSSHSQPTPRGGGLAIVISFIFCLPATIFFNGNSLSTSVALTLSGVGIALLGFLDDHGHIAARWRLLGHFFFAALILFFLDKIPIITIIGIELHTSWFNFIILTLYLVWMLNLYNFMDGIDGIASVEALCVCLSAVLLYYFSGFEQLIWSPLILSMAVSGFLYWNFPPAKIFMGDAGSGFLGITLGALSLQATIVAPRLLWMWVILLGVFIVDATFTLVRRLLRGEKIYEAHRSHAYQFAARRFGRHLPVTLSVGVINLFWLLPIAFCVVMSWLDGVVGVLLAYAPLCAAAIKFHAGRLEETL